jgi:hypothetical protein
MSQPWFDENMFGALWGSIVGGGGGTLGGLWGALIGTLAPRGKGRAWLIGIGWVFVGLGVLSLAFGLYALAAGQPYGIWYGPLLTGVMFTVVIGCLLPVVYKRYAEAEARRVQAEEFRGH